MTTASPAHLLRSIRSVAIGLGLVTTFGPHGRATANSSTPSPYGAYAPSTTMLSPHSAPPVDRVRDVLHEHAQNFKNCAAVLERHLLAKHHNDPLEDSVEAHIAVDQNGKIQSRPLSRESAKNQFQDCVLREAKTLNFGSLAHPVEISLAVEVACQSRATGRVVETRCITKDLATRDITPSHLP